MDKVSLDEKIYLALKEAIVNRELVPGTKLSEEVLASILNVSRTPVRSALQRLSYDRLVNIIPRRGAFVARPTAKEVKEAFEMRILLEEYALEKAFSKLKNSKSLLQVLENIVKAETLAYHKEGFDSVLERIRDFHMEIVQITDNKLLVKTLGDLIVLTNIYIVFYSEFNKDSPNSPREHVEILDAVKNGNLSKAKEKIRNHIEAIVSRLNFEKLKNPQTSFQEIIVNSFNKQFDHDE